MEEGKSREKNSSVRKVGRVVGDGRVPRRSEGDGSFEVKRGSATKVITLTRKRRIKDLCELFRCYEVYLWSTSLGNVVLRGVLRPGDPSYFTHKEG